MPEKPDRPASDFPAADTASPAELSLELVRAYQEAHRQLVEVQSAYQRAMTEIQVSFIATMKASLDGLAALAQQMGVALPAAEGAGAGEPETPARTAPAESATTESWAVWEEPAGEAAPPEPATTVPAPEAAASDPAAAVGPRDETEEAEAVSGRFVLRAEPTPPAGLALPGLAAAPLIAVTDEGTGVARALVEQLRARGVAAEVVDEVPPEVAGAILLGGLQPVASREDTIAVDRRAFLAARALARHFVTGRGVLVTVQDTGGDFGLGGRCGIRAGLGGLAALAKTARCEWPGVTVKAIDLERGGRPAWKLAKILAEELFAGGPELEVGLSADGRRVSLDSYPAPLDPASPEGVYSMVHRNALGPSSVIVASDGARGSVAAALVALARNARPRLVILGRTPLEPDDAGLGTIGDEDELRRELVARARAESRELSDEELEVRLGRILAAREIRANLAAIQQAGSEVSYHGVNLQDRVALAEVLDERRRRWGPITGIVHGAGVTSENLIADKTEDEFDYVFNTKVGGLFSLLEVTAGDPLELILLFSSTAARAGRRGQVDRAMADEVLNKVAAAERARRGDACLVKALDWSFDEAEEGPPASGRADVGRRSLTPELAARMLVEEIQAAVPDQVEVTFGLAPRHRDLTPHRQAMLTMDVFVSAATHPFLEGYRLGGIPVLPLSQVLEWLARLARAHAPDLEMASCRDLQVHRAVRLEGFYEAGDAFTLVSHQHASGRTRELHLELYARDGSLRYTAVADMVRPGTMVSTSSETARMIRATEDARLSPWPFSSVYGHALFQTSECQVIREVEGITEGGMAAVVAGSREMGWTDSWRCDVAALDGGLQLTVLWFQSQLGGTAVVHGLGAYRSYFSGLVEGPIRALLRGRRGEGFQRVVCDVAFINENGTLMAELRGVEARAAVQPQSGLELPVEIESEQDVDEPAKDPPADEPVDADEQEDEPEPGEEAAPAADPERRAEAQREEAPAEPMSAFSRPTGDEAGRAADALDDERQES